MIGTVLQVIKDRPGLSGAQIYRELVKRSRSGRWFGEDSLLAAIFGPSVGGMYVALATLEHEGLVRSEWGIATAERGGKRSRHYSLNWRQI